MDLWIDSLSVAITMLALSLVAADARCGQPSFSCHALPVSVGVPMMLAALLSDFGDAGLWLPPPVPLRCLMISATPLFRSHALLVSVGVPMMLAALLLADFGDVGLWLPLPRRFTPALCCPRGYVLVARSTPFPCLAPGLGMVCLIDLLGLVPLCLARLPPTVAWLVAGGCCLAYALFHSLLDGGDCGVWLCAPNLPVSSSCGGCCTQGCGVAALCDGWCVLLEAGGCLPWHLPIAPSVPLAPSLGMHACTWWVLRCCLRKSSRLPLRVVLLRSQARHGVLAMRGLWRMAVGTDPARFLAPWWLPQPGVRCQGPPCWLVCAARTFGLGCSSPRHGWRFPTHLWLPFTVAWCSSFRSRAALRALHCLPCKLPSSFPSPITTRFPSSWFVQCYKLRSFASRIPHCRSPLLCRLLLSPFSFFDFLYYSLYMAESLLAKLGDLNFTAEEQDAVVVVPESVAIPAEDFACSLVGPVLSSGPLDGGRVARLFRTIWKDDKKHWFTLEPADPAFTIHDYAFRYMCIWVRIHNIPLSLMMEALARTLGACIGKVVMTDTRLEDGNMGEFLRERVSLDTTKPLRRCVSLIRSNAKAILCPLQYERISIFCHGCGLIGHTVLQCPTTPQGEDQKLQFTAPLSSTLGCLFAPPSASAAAASVPAPAASDAAASVPVSAPVGPASSDAPVAAGHPAAVSAPLVAPSPREEDVYMIQPEGFVTPENVGKVCKLQRFIYGLKQASQSWNLHFNEAIQEFGFIRNDDEPCLYKNFCGSIVSFLICA
ncbi:hypothetical protein GQ457_03G017530 [Hibiscus cannabinus]